MGQLNTDKASTVSGIVFAIAQTAALILPKYSEIISQVAQGVAIIAVAVMGYLTNKQTAAPAP